MARNWQEKTFSLEKLACQECNFVFSTRENLTIHMQNVHSNLKLKSPENDEMSQEKSFLQRNETVEMHDIKVGHKNVQNKSKKLKCNKCPYTSYGQHNLMRHIRGLPSMTSMKISNFFTPSLPCHIHDHATYQYSCPLFDYPLPPSSADVIDGSPLRGNWRGLPGSHIVSWKGSSHPEICL